MFVKSYKILFSILSLVAIICSFFTFSYTYQNHKKNDDIVAGFISESRHNIAILTDPSADLYLVSYYYTEKLGDAINLNVIQGANIIRLYGYLVNLQKSYDYLDIVYTTNQSDSDVGKAYVADSRKDLTSMYKHIKVKAIKSYKNLLCGMKQEHINQQFQNFCA